MRRRENQNSSLASIRDRSASPSLQANIKQKIMRSESYNDCIPSHADERKVFGSEKKQQNTRLHANSKSSYSFLSALSLSIFSHALTRSFRCHGHIKGEFIIRPEKDNTLSAWIMTTVGNPLYQAWSQMDCISFRCKNIHHWGLKGRLSVGKRSVVMALT